MSLRNGNHGHLLFSVIRCPSPPGPLPLPFTLSSFGNTQGGGGGMLATESQLHVIVIHQVLHFLPHLASLHALGYLRISVGPWAPHAASCLPALTHTIPSAWILSPALPTWLTPFVLQSQLGCHLLWGALPDPSPPVSLTLSGHYPLTIIMALSCLPLR